MIKLLSFLLSWLFGLLAILLFSFYFYNYLSLIDILSFSIITLFSFTVTVILFYSTIIYFFKRIIGKKNIPYLYYIFLTSITNIPSYFVIWLYKDDAYGDAEAILLVLFFFCAGIVYGSCLKWKNKLLEA